VCDTSNELEAGWAPEPVSTCWKQRKSLPPAGNRSQVV